MTCKISAMALVGLLVLDRLEILIGLVDGSRAGA